MEGPLFLLIARLGDWPTILCGTIAGVLAWSRLSLAGATLLAALGAELILAQVRGWPIRPYWLAVGAVAALPWSVLGYAARTALLALVRSRTPPA